MIPYLKSMHAGNDIGEKLEIGKRFINSREFVEYSRVWEKQNISFWEETKHLLFWLKDV
jgi:hypothetical protein